MEGGDIPHTTMTSDVAAGYTRASRKRLSGGSTKTYKYTTVRKSIELTFNTESEKVQFEEKYEGIRLAFGCKRLKDALVTLIMNFSPSTHASSSPHRHQPLTMSSAMARVDGSTSQLDQGDGETATAVNEAKHENFIGQCSSIGTLIESISSHCAACLKPYSVQSWTHTGHVLSVQQSRIYINMLMSLIWGGRSEVKYLVVTDQLNCNCLNSTKYEP